MPLIDLQFQDDDQEAVETPSLGIDLEFEGQGDGPPLKAGETGRIEPVDRNIFEKIGDWYQEGYTRARSSIAQQKGLMLDETAQDRISTGVRVKELEREAERYGPELDMMQRLGQLNEVDSLGEGLEMVLTDPELLGYLTVSSLGRFAPTLAATAGVTAGTGGVGWAAIGTTGMGSLFIEYSATVDETMREAGFDSSDPVSWKRFAEDKDLQDRAEKRGLVRGIPIAVMDAFSMGISGRLIAGAKPTATSILTRSAGEIGQQAVTGGTGEYLAQLGEMAIGEREKTSPGEIAAEAAAEFGPGIVETLIGYRGAKGEALRKQAAEAAGADAAQKVADEKLTPDFEIKSLEENATAIDEALAAAPPTPETRPDEESITEKFDLEQEPTEAQPELPMDSEQLAAEQEANAFVLEQLRSQFPDASENELLAAVEVFKPAPETLPTEEDLGWVPPEQIKPEAVRATITPKPEQPRPDTEIPATREAGMEAEPGPGMAPEAVDEISRDEVVAATEPVERTGDALEAAEVFRTARPEFEGTILSFKPGDQRGDRTTPHYYGEIAETEDADGMPIDVVLNKNFDADTETPVFIVNQMDPKNQEFRQHKVMAGFDTAAAAEQGYVDMWGPDFFDSIHQLTPEQFQEWRAQGDHKSPYQETTAPETAIEPPGSEIEAPIEEISPDTTAVVEPEPPVEQTQPEEEAKAQAKATREMEQSERQKEKVAAARSPDSDVDDAVTFIRKLGGLNVEAQSDIPPGRLKHLDQERRQVGLASIEQTGDKGLTLEQVTEQLWEAGYIADNDSRLAIEMLFEAEQTPQYTARGAVAATQRQVDEQYNEELAAEAQAWADFVNETKEFGQVDPETARLMALAGAIDHDMMVDIASRDIPEADVQAALQAFIDERQAQEVEAPRAEKPAPAARPADEAEPEAAAPAAEDVTPAAPAPVEQPAPAPTPTLSLDDVLELSQEPTVDATPLDQIQLTYEIGDKKITHTAKWWLDAIDKRLKKVAELRTCA